MKRIFFIGSVLLLLLCSEVHGQTWSEWFRQGRTQRRYLRKQIALLKVYLTYLKEGYDIAQDGLGLISDIKDGDFSLHKNYFGSLRNVNPHLASSSQVANVFALQVQVVHGMRDINAFCQDNEHFTAEEVHYVTLVYVNLLALTEKSISELTTIIRSGEREMTDGERLRRIGDIHVDIQDKLSFVKSFAADMRMLAAEREREKNAIDQLKKQHEVI